MLPSTAIRPTFDKKNGKHFGPLTTVYAANVCPPKINSARD